MKLTRASSAAFVPVVSHEAATPDWPLGLLCSTSPDIEKEAQLPSTESQDGHQKLSLEYKLLTCLEEVWSEERIRRLVNEGFIFCHKHKHIYLCTPA